MRHANITPVEIMEHVRSPGMITYVNVVKGGKDVTVVLKKNASGINVLDKVNVFPSTVGMSV